MAWGPPKGLGASGNLSNDELKQQQARGAGGTRGPGSAGNIMPGASAVRPSIARAASGGATGGTGGNPARGGLPGTLGGPTSKAPRLPSTGTSVPGADIDSVRSHARAIGHATNLVNGGHMPKAQGAAIINKARAHIDAYHAAKPKAPKGPKFGSLGGMGSPGMGAGGSNLGGAATGAGGLGTSGGGVPGTPGGGSPFDM